ncbi:DUF4062 domain-containing protein [uncultured Gammaproteobacteria bacterium]
MSGVVRYQVFLSSTFEDLREERQQATQAILETGGFPSGMELFPASDDSQWHLIKRVIDESDYYIVIVGGKYGSIGPDGRSFTEMEYDYAVKQGIPVLGFVRDDADNIPSKFTEKTEDLRVKLNSFREKVLTRVCRKYRTPAELGMAVMKSLVSESRVRPRVGWVRADQARTEVDMQRERELFEKLEAARATNDELERKIRDMSVLTDDIPREKLAQGDDEFAFTVIFRDESKQYESIDVNITWNDILRIIGPSMYGYVVRKTGTYNNGQRYPFQSAIEHNLRSKIIDRVQGRKMDIDQLQIDTCIFQLKELGLIMFDESENDDGSMFRGITLTKSGERHLTILKTIQK